MILFYTIKKKQNHSKLTTTSVLFQAHSYIGKYFYFFLFIETNKFILFNIIHISLKIVYYGELEITLSSLY